MKLQFTKGALRSEELRFQQLQRYLPTLKLKKMLLQSEIDICNLNLKKMQKEFVKARLFADEVGLLLTSNSEESPVPFAEVKHVQKKYENIAGLEVPIFENVIFQDAEYALFDTPVWFDEVLSILKKVIIVHQKIVIEEERKKALAKELNDVSIRVNLFEKILIPRSEQNIRKIKIFLDDTQLSALAQAKVAKEKILKKKAYANQT